MEYRKTIILKDGRECVLRSASAEDAKAVIDVFLMTHTQTDNLASYPDEVTFTLEMEQEFLGKKAESDCEAEILAEVGGRLVGTAGISRVGEFYKVKHRAEFGISVDREYWGLGIGRALTQACIECAKKAGYAQIELGVVAGNSKAIALYESAGFAEYGRNPRGFRSRLTGWQELIQMRLELDPVQD